MLPDVNKYVRHLDGFDLDNREMTELGHTFWQIMGSLMERVFAGERATAPLAVLHDRGQSGPSHPTAFTTTARSS